MSKSQVDDLRRSVADLRTDVDESVGRQHGEHHTAGGVRVPDGTNLVVRLDVRVPSKYARPDDRVEATVAEPVRVDGRVAIPAGATVEGRCVTSSLPSARRTADASNCPSAPS